MGSLAFRQKNFGLRQVYKKNGKSLTTKSTGWSMPVVRVHGVDVDWVQFPAAPTTQIKKRFRKETIFYCPRDFPDKI